MLEFGFKAWAVVVEGFYAAGVQVLARVWVFRVSGLGLELGVWGLRFNSSCLGHEAPNPNLGDSGSSMGFPDYRFRVWAFSMARQVHHLSTLMPKPEP